MSIAVFSTSSFIFRPRIFVDGVGETRFIQVGEQFFRSLASSSRPASLHSSPLSSAFLQRSPSNPPLLVPMPPLHVLLSLLLVPLIILVLLRPLPRPHASRPIACDRAGGEGTER